MTLLAPAAEWGECAPATHEGLGASNTAYQQFLLVKTATPVPQSRRSRTIQWIPLAHTPLPVPCPQLPFEYLLISMWKVCQRIEVNAQCDAVVINSPYIKTLLFRILQE
jgi:hypothetical protein